MEKNNRIGYSSKIDDPAFTQYLKNSNRWSAWFSLGLALIAIVGFFIHGEMSDNMENPESLYIGLVIGSMFMLIAFYQIHSRKRDKTWDGMVVDKRVKKKQRRARYDDTMVTYTEYTVLIRSDAGKKHEVTAEDDDTVYNYYKVGDKIRHHKGLNSYEKYDKSGDAIIFCNACGSLNKFEDEKCFRCKCPLLK